MIQQLHLGRGTSRGALSVFPIWAEDVHPVSYSVNTAHARVVELSDGDPDVGSLWAMNSAGVPLLLIEGQLLEGGLQHRMLTRSMLLAPAQATALDVVCVEQGRWSGTSDHAARVGELVRGMRPYPGQVGLLVGLAGQPLVTEVFDSPRMLARQFEAIVRAAAIDAIDLQPAETPGRRARRFLTRAASLRPRTSADAGIAVARTARSEYVDLKSVQWEGRALHTLLTNPRHDLVLAA